MLNGSVINGSMNSQETVIMTDWTPIPSLPLEENHSIVYSSTPPIREGLGRRPDDTITLQQEFDLVNFDFPGLSVIEVNGCFKVVTQYC